MRLAGRIGWMTLVVCLSMQANAGDPVATFNDAKSYAQGTVDGTGGIVDAEMASTLPHYTPLSPVPALAPGSTGINAAGAAKIEGCQGQNDTECAAVNFLAKNPGTRLQFNINPATDPSLAAGKQVLSNPSALAEGFSETTETACSTRTENTPASYTNEVCNEYLTSTEEQCSIGQQVTVDADANYQCDEKTKEYETLKCKRQNVCSVSGQTINCANKSFLCYPGAQACCSFSITCGASGGVTVVYRDCCGYTQTKSASAVSDFYSPGFQYNWNGQSRLICDASGQCRVDFTNYFCSNPSNPIGYYPNVNQFSFGLKPTFSCYLDNQCAGLEARAK